MRVVVDCLGRQESAMVCFSAALVHMCPSPRKRQPQRFKRRKRLLPQQQRAASQEHFSRRSSGGTLVDRLAPRSFATVQQPRSAKKEAHRSRSVTSLSKWDAFLRSPRGIGAARLGPATSAWLGLSLVPWYSLQAHQRRTAWPADRRRLTGMPSKVWKLRRSHAHHR